MDDMEFNPDKELADFLYKKLLPQFKTFDANYKEVRADNVKFFKGDQWRRKQSRKKAKSVTNFLSLIIRDEVAILTDAMPDIKCLPAGGEADQAKATIIEKLVNHILYRNNFQEKLNYAVLTAATKHVAYLRPVWNPLLSDGQGDVEILIDDADTVSIDPSGENGWFCSHKMVTMAEIYRLWPEKAEEIKAEGQEKKVTPMDGKKSEVALPVQSTDKSESYIPDNSPSVMVQYERVKVDCWYVRDDSVEKAYEDKDGEKVEKVIAKYPNGRWVTFANEKVKLDDKPCMIRHFPLVPLILQPDPENKIYGISNIDFCKQQQVDHNEMAALTKDWYRSTVYPKLTYDPNSAFDPQKTKNIPGQSYAIAPGQSRFDAPLSVPNDLFAYIQKQKDDIEYVSAMSDIMQGRRPASITSAEGIRLLQESARVVSRPKSRLIESAVKKLGELLIDYTQVGYTTPRMVRVIGVDAPNQAPNQMMGAPNQLGDPNAMMGGPNQMGPQMPDPNMLMINAIDDARTDITIGEYDLIVIPDSTLPKSEVEKWDRLMALAQLGMVDRRAILEVSGLPNWREIEARMQAKEDEAKAMMMMSQQQAPNQGGENGEGSAPNPENQGPPPIM